MLYCWNQITLQLPTYVYMLTSCWCLSAADGAMSGEVIRQQDPGSGANDNAVPQPSGSTKTCNSFYVNMEDDFEEEDDNDADNKAGLFLSSHFRASSAVCILLGMCELKRR